MKYRTTGTMTMGCLTAAVLFAACSGAVSDRTDPGGEGEGKNGGVGGGTPGASAQAPATAAMRRLTVSQYRNIIADVFGNDVVVPALEMEPAAEGYTSVGASTIGTSRVGVERYQAAATTVAAQIFKNEAQRMRLVGCAPSGDNDLACMKSYLERLGRTLYRRPLTSPELSRLVDLGEALVKDNEDFWKGMEWATVALLQSPKFLYRSEFGEAASNGLRRFKGVELASRLSFFLANTAPDEALLDAGQKGTLDKAEGLREHAQRLLASPRARRGFRTFFQELMRLDDPVVAQDVAKTVALPESLFMATREQTLRTLEDGFFEQGADIAEALRSPVTFVNRSLAEHYGIQAPAGEGFARVTLPAAGPRTGILGHASLLIKMSNQPHSAPTARGKFVREALLCQQVPPPPDGVNTELEEVDLSKPMTMRERLDGHRSNPACASCHAMTDPIGLALENFDSLGKYRQKENGLPIDPSGELDGEAFADARGLAEAVSRHPELHRCFVRQLYRHATGQVEPEEAQALDTLAAKYSRNRGTFNDLVTELVTSDVFLTVSQPL